MQHVLNMVDHCRFVGQEEPNIGRLCLMYLLGTVIEVMVVFFAWSGDVDRSNCYFRLEPLTTVSYYDNRDHCGTSKHLQQCPVRNKPIA